MNIKKKMVYSLLLLVLIEMTYLSHITDLQSTTDEGYINWTYKNPADSNFSHIMVYFDDEFKKNPSSEFYNAADLSAVTTHHISTRTVDNKGNINLT